METKKSAKASLEKKRFAFFQIGLIVSTAIAVVAFEYITPSVIHKTHIRKVDASLPGELPPIVPDIPEPQPEVQKKTTVIPPDAEFIETDDPDKDNKVVIIDDPINDPLIDMGEVGDTNTAGPVIVSIDKSRIWDISEIEKMPDCAEYPQYLQKNLRFPADSREEGHQGTVYVEFVVTTEGSISGVKVLDSKGTVDRKQEKEAMRVVKGMPKWTPGTNLGYPVPVRLVLPIKFVLVN